jgi:hypothetical protein
VALDGRTTQGGALAALELISELVRPFRHFRAAALDSHYRVASKRTGMRQQIDGEHAEEERVLNPWGGAGAGEAALVDFIPTLA